VAQGLSELSDDELERLLELVAGADSVELKLTVSESDQRAADLGTALPSRPCPNGVASPWR
jgi:hypothetical protein